MADTRRNAPAPPGRGSVRRRSASRTVCTSFAWRDCCCRWCDQVVPVVPPLTLFSFFLLHTTGCCTLYHSRYWSDSVAYCISREHLVSISISLLHVAVPASLQAAAEHISSRLLLGAAATAPTVQWPHMCNQWHPQYNRSTTGPGTGPWGQVFSLCCWL